MMKTPLIKLHNVTMEYSLRSLLGKRPRFCALENIDLEIFQGEALGVVGRNGCGKSTLLRILAGVMEPSSGKIEIEGNTTRALLSLGLGFNRELSGRDNALLSAMLQGYSKKNASEMLPEIHEYSELGDFFYQPVKMYSSGMRSKLGFATAIVTDVDILLIDETLSVGDSQFKEKAERTMLERISGNQTVVFVSHQIGQIKKVCERAIWLEDGAIKSEGGVDEVAQNYSGSMQELKQYGFK